ncbi:MAG: hypothetical protein Q4F24_16250 [Eubacteriales bacterium]|nr:hypothetical protein [Eubacteriales bacterium]
MSKFLKFIVHMVIFLAILDVLALAVPPFMGINTAIIDGTKESNMPKGSVTYAESVSINELKADDSILVQEGESVYRYKIIAADAANGTFDVYDQTDVEAGQKTITLRNTAPRVIITVGYIGYLIIATQSMEGLIIIGLVILFLIILFILSELWRKDKRIPAAGEFESADDEAIAEVAASREPAQESKSKREIKKEMKKRAKEESRRDKERARQEYEEATRQLKQEAKERKKQAKRKKKEAKKRARVGGFIEDYDPIEAKIPQKRTQETKARTTYTPEDEANEVLRQEVAAATAETIYMEPVPSETPRMSETKETVFSREVLREEAARMVRELSVEEPEPVQEPEEVPVKKMAIPTYTEEELLARAQEAGETPNVVRDEQMGVTLLDYSDIIIEETPSDEGNTQ